MSSRARRAAWTLAFAGAAAVLFGLAFAQFGPYLEHDDLDHGLHVRFAQRLLTGGPLLPHFLYHLLVVLAAGLSPDLADLLRAARVVLGLLVLAKLAVSLGLARELGARAGTPLQPSEAFALAWALFFVAPLPKWWRPENVYLGQLSPTVWHNPTAIAALPLAIAAFWAFTRARTVSPRNDLGTGALVALSVVTKPNFALAFLPAVVLLRLWRREGPLARQLAALACLAGPSLLVLAWQYQHALALGLEAPGAGMLSVQPLEVWHMYSPHPLVSALVSLAFPLAVAAFAAAGPRHGRTLLAAWLVVAVAVLQFALLAEPEPKLGDANYYWGVVPAVYLLFLVSACELLAESPTTSRRRAARRACWVVLALHVASGVFLYLHPFQLAVVD